MKKISSLLVALLLGLALLAQTTPSQEYLRRYNNLVQRVGASGVGVETLLDKWAADYPDDISQLLARFSFSFDRCQTSKVIDLPQERYLGREPILATKDSLGRPRNFFEDFEYDDLMYAEAERALDRILSLQPDRLDVILLKIKAMTAYEKGSPDMALSALVELADRNYKQHPAWIYEGVDRVDAELFKALVQEHCFTFYRLGTDASAEAFRTLSERMLHYCKDDPLFLNNLGSYYLVCKKNSKKALKYYNKVLKAHPDDLTAIRNCLLLARSEKDTKLEKKYLPMMARYGETESDRAAAQARLEVLSKK